MTVAVQIDATPRPNSYWAKEWGCDEMLAVADLYELSVNNTHDLLETYGTDGLEWLQKHGTPGPAYFEVAANSRHNVILEQFLNQKGIRVVG